MSVQYEVIIIGAGPSGLAAARSLLEEGVKNVLILEREQQAGGVPRHCRHPTFGVQTFHRPMRGHVWAARILAMVQGKYEIRTATTVIAIRPGGEVGIASDRGLQTLRARRIIIATGARETPRHPRLVSGLRPQGILTTGALQQFIYLRQLKPGLHPVIIGSELVSFSAIWTLGNAGIKTLALIDEHSRPLAFRPSVLYAKLLGVKVFPGARLTRINGGERVESIEFRDANGQIQRLICDSVIFTGRFTGEYTLIRKSHLAFEPASGRPLFDQYGRCSDPACYVVGNMTHPADMGDQCYQEGQRVGRNVAASMRKTLPAHSDVRVQLDDTFRLVAPNMLALTAEQQMVTLNVRVNRFWHGQIVVRSGDRVLYQRKHRCLPERRILLKPVPLARMQPGQPLMVTTQCQ